jgi:Domain of unknown function (DUF1963)
MATRPSDRHHADARMQWGDEGRIYLCAHNQDPVTRRFDQCWMVVQCY